MNSSGKQLLNTDYDCSIHVYDQNNNHIIVANLTDDSNGVDEYINIPDTIIPNMPYTYLVACDSVEGESAFVSVDFEITKEGKDPDRVFLSLGAALLMIALLFAVLKITFSIDAEEHMNIKLLMTLISMIIVTIISKTALSIVQSLNTTSIIVNSFITFYRVSLVLFFLFNAYFILFYYIPKIFEYINEKIIKRK